MIRIVVVDDHPALRAGLETVLRTEPGIVPVGAVGTVAELPALLRRTRPDVVVLDYHLDGEDGLLSARLIKREVPAPRVLLYTAYASSALAIPAALAGVDGVLSKGVPARELFDAIRRVSRGETVGAPVADELVEEAAERVGPQDRPLLVRALAGETPSALAAELGLAADEVSARIDEMIRRLRVDVPEVAH